MASVGSPNWSAVTDDKIIEWIATMPPHAANSMARRLAIAEELGQKNIIRYLHKMIRAWAASNGSRVRMVYEIAKQEEAVQTAQELYAPRRGV